MSGPAGKLPALQIHPTRQCNLSCLHCYSSSGPSVRAALDETLVIGVIREAAQLGYRVLAVSGGEPLLYTPLPSILRAAHDCGMATTVTTNGMLLDKRRLAMIEPDADLLAISLDGIPDSHNEMRGSGRAFSAMAKHLGRLRDSGVPFGFIFTLTFHNVNELDWVAQFAFEQGAKLLQIHPLEPVGRAEHELAEALPDDCERAMALIEAARLRDIYGEQMQIHVDLATLPALEAQPERVFAGAAGICGAQTIAEVLAPIVLETSGMVAPLQYGFPREWCLGDVRRGGLRELAVRWMQSRFALFQDMCREVHTDLLSHPEDPVINWYVAVHAAAVRASPRMRLEKARALQPSLT